jgi:uncharacterized membrane protein YkvA (DUF1232 family)
MNLPQRKAIFANNVYLNSAVKGDNMEDQFKDFYDVLRENLDNYRGEYESFIDYGPDIYELLTDILNEKSLNSKLRMKICAALGYFVVPFDIIPEQIYGPHGYIDDIFLCSYVLKEIQNEKGVVFLDELWNGDEDIEAVLDVCYNQSKEILGDKVSEILNYVGF